MCNHVAMDPAALAAVPLFSGLTEDQLATVAAALEESEVLTGTEITANEDYAYRFFVILGGHVEVSRDGRARARSA